MQVSTKIGINQVTTSGLSEVQQAPSDSGSTYMLTPPQDGEPKVTSPEMLAELLIKMLSQDRKAARSAATRKETLARKAGEERVQHMIEAADARAKQATVEAIGGMVGGAFQVAGGAAGLGAADSAKGQHLSSALVGEGQVFSEGGKALGGHYARTAGYADAEAERQSMRFDRYKKQSEQSLDELNDANSRIKNVVDYLKGLNGIRTNTEKAAILKA